MYGPCHQLFKACGVDMPFVSVIVPVYNSAHTLPALLDALMALDYPESQREILIVDNGSTDATPDIVRRYPVTLLEEHAVLTSYGARNCGARQARGDVLAFTDGDCVPDPGWLTGLVAGIDDPSTGITVGEVVAYDLDSPIARLTDEMGIMAHSQSLEHKSLSSASTANMLVKREVWQAVNGFDETLPAFGDMDFCWRVQIELGLSVGYRPDAIIRHQHRTTYKALWRQALRHGWGAQYMHRSYPDHYAMSTGENSGRIAGLLRELFIGTPGPDRWHRPAFLFIWYAGMTLGYFGGRLGWNSSFRYQPEQTT